MARRKATSPETFLHTLFSSRLIRQKAREIGMFVRQRKVDAYCLFSVVALSVGGRKCRSIADLGEILHLRTGINVARFTLYARFTRSFERLVCWALGEVEARARSKTLRASGALRGFTDVVAMDATVVQVDPLLAKLWPGTRRNSSPAAIKVHTQVRATSGELLRHKITPEAYGDVRAFGFTWGDTGKLFLADMAYSTPKLWRRIHKVGAYFVARLPSGHRPVITKVLSRHRGRTRSLVGKRLGEITRNLKRSVIEVERVFRAEVRPHGEREDRRYEKIPFRVVGLWNSVKRRYHFYVTNLPPDRLEAEGVGEMYRLRWEVETFYKTAKSGLGLGEIRSTKPHNVRTLVEAALLRASVAMQAMGEAWRSLSPYRWIGAMKWVKVWQKAVEELLPRKGRDWKPPRITWMDLAQRAMDLNRKRPPTRWRLALELVPV
ncbi:MAG: IS4-like element ISH8C family transposase [Planctomycetota bacterium]